MKMNDVRDIHIRIREKYPPKTLDPEILQDIIHILFEYIRPETIPDKELHKIVS